MKVVELVVSMLRLRGALIDVVKEFVVMKRKRKKEMRVMMLKE